MKKALLILLLSIPTMVYAHVGEIVLGYPPTHLVNCQTELVVIKGEPKDGIWKPIATAGVVGLLANTFGGGSGKTLLTVAGVVGGYIYGENERQKNTVDTYTHETVCREVQ